MEMSQSKARAAQSLNTVDLGELRRSLDECKTLLNAVGTINPRPPGLHNELIQLVKKLIARMLAWYTRPLKEFNSSVCRSLDTLAGSVENLQRDLVSIDGRLTQLEQNTAGLSASLRTRIELLSKQVESLTHSGQHPPLGTPNATMEADWDSRARENSWFFIDTGHFESEEAFEKAGQWALDTHVLQGIDLSPDATVLEIGCGIGRLLKPLARRAGVVIGVDISGEMVNQARLRLAAFPNIRIHKTEGNLSMVDTCSVDFCFSYIVFQHFPAKEPIFAYFEEAARVLRPGGIFRFQVNQRPERFVQTYVAGTWEGVGVEDAEVTAQLEQAGFRTLDAWGEMGSYAWYTAEEVRKLRPKGAEVRLQFRPTILDPAAARDVFERIGEMPSRRTLDGLLSHLMSWRMGLDFLLEKWSLMTDEEFIRSVYRALLNREVEAETLAATLSMMQDGTNTRSYFLDCLVSSKEFRDVLSGLKA